MSISLICRSEMTQHAAATPRVAASMGAVAAVRVLRHGSARGRRTRPCCVLAVLDRIIDFPLSFNTLLVIRMQTAVQAHQVEGIFVHEDHEFR